MNINKVITTLVILTMTSTIVPIVYADQKSADKIKFRQSGMMFMRWNMGVIKKNVIKAPQDYNKQAVIDAANVIKSITHSGMFTLFTSDTVNGKGWKATRVKSEFFTHPEDVKDHVKKVRSESLSLSEVAQSGDINKIKIQFKSLLNSCKACHKDFRGK